MTMATKALQGISLYCQMSVSQDLSNPLVQCGVFVLSTNFLPSPASPKRVLRVFSYCNFLHLQSILSPSVRNLHGSLLSKTL